MHVRFGIAPRVLFLASLSAACAPVAPLPPATPEVPVAAWERAANATKAPDERPPSGEQPPSLAKTGPVPAPKSAAPPSTPSARTAPSPVVGGTSCLTELASRGVRFSRSEPMLGVRTPIVVEGPIGGVRFYTLEKKPLVVDCRLALALDAVAPDLRALGVTDARYSGAYVYRTSHPGRMSLHAYGLAIDLHEFKVNGEGLLVKSSFERGRGCSSALPLLNQLACRVRERHLFHEQLGPDDNADHYDHFHLGLRPLPDEVAADLPWPTAPPPRTKKRAAPGVPGSIPEVIPNGARSVSAKARISPARRAR
ncbi:MAG TPA: extensin family protein [Polyangiaceae bacterium]